MCVCLCYVVLCSRGDADSAVCTQWSGVWQGQCWLSFYLLFYFRWREENEVLNIHVRLGGLEVVTNIFYSWYSLSKEFSLPPIQTYWIMDEAQRFRRVSSDDRKVHAAIQILFFLSTMHLRGSSFLFLCLLFFNQRESCKRYLSQKSTKKVPRADADRRVRSTPWRNFSGDSGHAGHVRYQASHGIDASFSLDKNGEETKNDKGAVFHFY